MTPSQENNLYAVFDLAVAEKNVDLVSFLVAASAFADAENIGMLHLVVLPDGAADGEVIVEDDSIPDEWRARHLFAAASSLMTVPCTPSIFTSRADAVEFLDLVADHYFPSGYDADVPETGIIASEMIPQFDSQSDGGPVSADNEAIDYVEKWVFSRSNGRLPVTIALPRLSEFQDHDVWIGAANTLGDRGYFTICLPVIEDTMIEPPKVWRDLNVYAEAASNTIIQAALFQFSKFCIVPCDDRLPFCHFNPNVSYIAVRDNSRAPTFHAAMARQDHLLDMPSDGKQLADGALALIAKTG